MLGFGCLGSRAEDDFSLASDESQDSLGSLQNRPLDVAQKNQHSDREDRPRVGRHTLPWARLARLTQKQLKKS